MQRRTKNISLVMLAAIAAAACDEHQSQTTPPNEDLKHCVDENGVVQDEEKCKDAPESHPMGPDGGPIASHPSSGGGGHFFWYYGGSGTPIARGSRVSGGSYTPSTGRSYSPPSTHGGGSSPSIGRGGFGGTGAGHGSGGGGTGGGG